MKTEVLRNNLGTYQLYRPCKRPGRDTCGPAALLMGRNLTTIATERVREDPTPQAGPLLIAEIEGEIAAGYAHLGRGETLWPFCTEAGAAARPLVAADRAGAPDAPLDRRSFTQLLWILDERAPPKSGFGTCDAGARGSRARISLERVPRF